MAVKELGLSSIEPKFRQLIERNIPSNEVPLIVCHNSSDAELYVITKFTAARITLRANWENPTTIVYFDNVVSIREASFPGFLGASHIVSLYGHDTKRALTGFSFSRKDALYFKFTKILRDAYNRIKAPPNPERENLTSKTAGERLAELNHLLENKLITEAEYQRKRAEILRDL